MKTSRGVAFCLCSFVYANFLLAQIQLSEVVHNVGKITKQQTPITHEFIIKNQGSSPLVIQKVIPDCACSTVSYTQTPIAPGNVGSVKVMFSPYRLGPFQKIFTVYIADPQPRMFTLKLEGYIAPSLVDTPETSFPYVSGTLRFRRKNLNFGTITNEAVVSKRFEIYNAGKDTVFFTNRIETPTHIRVYFDSSLVIPPGKIGSIVVTYDPKLKGATGFFQENVVLFTKNPTQPRVEVNMIANIQPTAGVWLFEEEKSLPSVRSVDMQLGPRLQVSEEVQVLGDLYLNVPLTTEFVIYNEGGKLLEISDIQPEEGCEILSERQIVLAPQEFAIVQVRFIHNGTLGKQTRYFTIISNDELNPRRRLEMQVNVVTATR
ncbi:MAG: DUF1573 domain-containing protein [Cytophagales bacterium]|nr:DUF1573 domain-containing protein [Bernardetiaceae bacterium]MDW8210072.1 DUF1573 domain-containing protein [Cytophagales bacterium]